MAVLAGVAAPAAATAAAAPAAAATAAAAAALRSAVARLPSSLACNLPFLRCSTLPVPTCIWHTHTPLSPTLTPSPHPLRPNRPPPCSTLPAYVHLLDLFHDVTYQTSHGQLLDTTTAPIGTVSACLVREALSERGSL